MSGAAGRPPAWAVACMAASMALVGSYVGLSKLLLATFPIFLLAWLRFGIAAVAMLSWLPRRAQDVALTPRLQAWLFAESFFGNFLFSILMLWGVRLTSATVAGVVMAAIPAAVAIFSRLGLGERIRPATALGIACAVSGVALLAWARGGTPDGGPATDWRGPLLLVGAVCCEALYVVIGKHLMADLSPKRLSAIVNLWGLVLVTPLGLAEALDFSFAAVPASIWALLVFYALAASMVTVWLWMTGLRHVPASTAGVYTVMLPLSAAAVGVFVLGERPQPLHGLAMLLALVGIVLASGVGFSRRRARS